MYGFTMRAESRAVMKNLERDRGVYRVGIHSYLAEVKGHSVMNFSDRRLMFPMWLARGT